MVVVQGESECRCCTNCEKEGDGCAKFHYFILSPQTCHLEFDLWDDRQFK